jgi:hypothetical protein
MHPPEIAITSRINPGGIPRHIGINPVAFRKFPINIPGNKNAEPLRFLASQALNRLTKLASAAG